MLNLSFASHTWLFHFVRNESQKTSHIAQYNLLCWVELPTWPPNPASWYQQYLAIPGSLSQVVTEVNSEKERGRYLGTCCRVFVHGYEAPPRVLSGCLPNTNNHGLVHNAFVFGVAAALNCPRPMFIDKCFVLDLAQPTTDHSRSPTFPPPRPQSVVLCSRRGHLYRTRITRFTALFPG